MKTEQLKQAVKEFKTIYKDLYGIDLNDQEATKKTEDLLQLFDCLTRLKEV